LEEHRKTVLNELIAALIKQGKTKSAFDVFDHLLALYPQCWETLNAYALILYKCGKKEAALEKLQTACSLNSSNAEIYNNTGVVLKALGRTQEALHLFTRALALQPGFADALYNRGNSLNRLRQYEDAVHSYNKAIEQRPDFADAHYSRANALNALLRFHDAELGFHAALRLRPDDWAAHYGLGRALFEQGRLDAAIASLERAGALKADEACIFVVLGDSWRARGDEIQAKQAYHQALKLKFGDLNLLGSLLFSLHYLQDISFYRSVRITAKINETLSTHKQDIVTHDSAHACHKKLRIGFVSGDFRSHPVGYFLENVLANLNKTDFEWIAFAAAQKSDSLSKRLKAHFTQWIPIYDLNDRAAAQCISEQNIDLLIDLSGHTAYNRLPVFALRPAPVQATWLGYHGTTGLQEIDYIIGDPYVTPLDEQDDFSEIIIQMPHTYLCFSPPQEPITVNALPAGTNGYVTFGCLNHAYKINPSVIAAWAGILQQVPSSKLFLKSKKFDFPATRKRIITAFEASGISRDRLIIKGASPREELLRCYNDIDIALDPFPFCGVTTSVEALWMGVPVVTVRGCHFISHVGEMIALNAGLSDWIADNCDDYVKRAVAFAGDLDRLAGLRQQLRSRFLASALCDAQTFAGDFEQIVRKILYDRPARLMPAKP